MNESKHLGFSMFTLPPEEDDNYQVRIIEMPSFNLERNKPNQCFLYFH